ncbi:MAG: phosphate ABC transporter ATP-binding protein [Chloroflexota bacterium]
MRKQASSAGEGLPLADPAAAVFAFERVSVSFGDAQILREIDVHIPGSGVTAVLGPSGSGKSTLTRLCNRLLDPTEGVVSLRGTDLRRLDVIKLRRAVGMVFQRPTMFQGSVRDNLSATGVTDPSSHLKVLRWVDLDREFLDRTASTLSGGESQRVCLARTLLMRPEVLVADEPTASLDETSARTLEALACAQAARGVPVLWVTHDLSQFDRIADHGIVLDGGRVVASGPSEKLRASRGGLGRSSVPVVDPDAARLFHAPLADERLS